MSERVSDAHLLFPFASCAEPKERLNNVAPFGIACIWARPDLTVCSFDGYGGERSPPVMFARTVIAAVHAVLDHDPDADLIECITEQKDLLATKERDFFKQSGANRLSADGYDVYKELFALQALVSLRFRPLKNAEEKMRLAKAYDTAREVRKKAAIDFEQHRKRYATPGILLFQERR